MIASSHIANVFTRSFFVFSPLSNEPLGSWLPAVKGRLFLVGSCAKKMENETLVIVHKVKRRRLVIKPGQKVDVNGVMPLGCAFDRGRS